MQNGSPSLQDVRALLERDGHKPVLLYIPAKEKGPHYPGWQNITYEQTQSLKYQRLLQEHPNTGVLLGVDDLCQIDCDTDPFLDAMLESNLVFTRTLRTHGARGGGLWFYLKGNRPQRVIALKVKADSPLAIGAKGTPDKDGMITVGELRCGGCQSLIRGIHPLGCFYQWLMHEVPLTIDFSTIVWPSDIATPWETEHRTGVEEGTAPYDQFELLRRAIAKVSIDLLWQHFGFPERRHNPVPSPFRTDNTRGHDSFSVYDQGRRFKDHNASYEHHRGDSFDFYQLGMRQDAKTAFVGFVELAGLGDELRRNRSDAAKGTKQKDSAETQEQQADTEEPQRILIEFLRPSQVLAYDPPPGIVLAGDNHIVRDAVFVLAGAPGVGKSRLIVWLARCGALEVPWMGYDVHTQFRTLIIQNENGRYRLKLEFEGLDCPQLEDYLLITPPPPFGLCFDRREFREQLKVVADNFQPHLVAIDPWNAAARDDRAKDYLETFNDIRTVFPPGFDGPAIGIVAHTRKPYPNERASGRALLNLLAGSYVLTSVPRSAWVVQAASDDVEDERIVLTCSKNNDGQFGARSAWMRHNGLFVPVDSFDWETFDHPEGKADRYNGTIEDLFEMIPVVSPISRADLVAKVSGKIGQNRFKEFLAELLRKGRIFIHKIPNPVMGFRSFAGYAKTPPKDTDIDVDIDEGSDNDTDIEEDPR
jgi:hypothetical protein